MIVLRHANRRRREVFECWATRGLAEWSRHGSRRALRERPQRRSSRAGVAHYPHHIRLNREERRAAFRRVLNKGGGDTVANSAEVRVFC